ncbi:MAG: TonB-dependent receptor plug domain-containing protein [Alistipes sp.]|nr:TonB-dependent receptor plug domain-containing protein [Alistipes sp.]
MRQLIITLLAVMLFAAAEAQTPFNGRIRHLDGSGIKATVRVKDSNKTTRSDGKGRFGLTDIKDDDTLYIIYKRDTLEIPVSGRRSIDIIWASEGETFKAEESEELMNYGFGYVKRRESTDFSSGISGDRLRATGSTSLLQAILICYPGLRYINGELCLRTQNSINSSSAVLVLCDGMEVSNIDMINIYDVGSVEIIKSSNMYGFRGVHGVVLIKTISADEALNRKR